MYVVFSGWNKIKFIFLNYTSFPDFSPLWKSINGNNAGPEDTVANEVSY